MRATWIPDNNRAPAHTGNARVANCEGTNIFVIPFQTFWRKIRRDPRYLGPFAPGMMEINGQLVPWLPPRSNRS